MRSLTSWVTGLKINPSRSLTSLYPDKQASNERKDSMVSLTFYIFATQKHKK